MRQTVLAFLLLLSTGLVLQQCRQSGDQDVRPDIRTEPFEFLSEYRFFTGDLKYLTPNKGVLPYDLNTPLFSDYAEKSRFVRMPEGVSARYDSLEVFEFPVGTVLIKNFFYYNDKRSPEKGRRILETRLLINRESGWDAMTYIWNDEQTEAVLDLVGDVKTVDWITGSGAAMQVKYIIPNRNQCKGCHDVDGKIAPIGPKAGNLNKPYDYGGRMVNQLDQWVETGYLTGFDSADQPPFLAQWDTPDSGSLHDRAMAYLDVNCGHCHNPHGPANTSGLNLTVNEKPGAGLGIFKAPVSAGKGSGGRLYSIVPGQPDASILPFRMESTDPGAMMPELGRTTVHKEGVELIRRWIEEMD